MGWPNIVSDELVGQFVGQFVFRRTRPRQNPPPGHDHCVLRKPRLPQCPAFHLPPKVNFTDTGPQERNNRTLMRGTSTCLHKSAPYRQNFLQNFPGLFAEGKSIAHGVVPWWEYPLRRHLPMYGLGVFISRRFTAGNVWFIFNGEGGLTTSP